jgi:hypothetical protein
MHATCFIHLILDMITLTLLGKRVILFLYCYEDCRSGQKSFEVPHYIIFPAAGYFHFLTSMYSLQHLCF